MASPNNRHLRQELQHLNAEQLRRRLMEHLTKRMCWVNDDGSLCSALNFDDMRSALDRLAQTRPGSLELS